MAKFKHSFKLVSLVVSITTLVAALPATGAVWRPEPLPQTSSEASLTLDDGWRFFGVTSSITKLDATHTVWGDMCEGWAGDCELKPGLNAVANLILPVCDSATQINCLESFSMGTSQSALAAAKLTRQVAGYTIPAQPASGIPQGGLPGIWEAPVQHAGGTNLYAVNPRIVLSVRDGVVKAEDFQVSVWPISNQVSGGKTPVFFRPGDANRKASVEGMWDAQCAVVDTNYCGQIEDFAPQSVVNVTVRISNSITGWLKGRLTNPAISSAQFGADANRFVLQGEPVTVPKLGARVSSSDPEFVSSDGRTTIGSAAGNYHVLRADSPTGIKFVKKLAQATKDTAAATETLWYLGSIGNTEALARCTPSAGQFIGLVTTNSMAFDGSVPQFESGYFSYNVAGLHFAPDGKTENLGTYDLAIQSDVARCLYGFSRAPISATITVTGSTGEQKVAVTEVRERSGWLLLSAKGFTFSENQIKVQLRQAKTFAIAKFAGSTNRLNRAQSSAISNAVNGYGPVSDATCSVFYRSAKDRSLALQRASAVCALVKKSAGAAVITSVAKATTSNANNGRVSITLN
jgi:hypothetical protein